MAVSDAPLTAACLHGGVPLVGDRDGRVFRADGDPVELARHRGAVRALVSAGPLVASVGEGGVVRAWPRGLGELRRQAVIPGPLICGTARDGVVFVGAADGRIWWWDVDLGPARCFGTVTAPARALALLEDGRLLAAQGTLSIIELDVQGHPVRTLDGHLYPPSGLHVPPGERVLWSLDPSPLLIRWDLDEHLDQRVRSPDNLPGFEGPHRALAVDPGGRWLAVAGGDTVRVLSADALRLLATWQSPVEITALAAGADGGLLVGGEDGRLRVLAQAA